MFCSKCGNQIKPGEGFCTGCGTPIQSVNPPTQPDLMTTPQPPQSEGGVNPIYQEFGNPNQMPSNANYYQGEPKKPKKALKIVGSVFGGFILLGILIFIIVSLTSEKLICKSSEGNITIMYNSKTITGYKASGITFDMDIANGQVSEIGINQYLEAFKEWFRTNTSGSCEQKTKSNNSNVNNDNFNNDYSSGNDNSNNSNINNNSENNEKTTSKCTAIECIKQIKTESTVEEINQIIGFNGELVDERYDEYYWKISETSGISVTYYSGTTGNIKVDVEQDTLRDSRVNLSQMQTIKDKINDGLTYEQVKSYVGNVDGILIEKSSYSLNYIWVNANGGYMDAYFSVSDGYCTIMSGMNR